MNQVIFYFGALVLKRFA